MNTCDLEWRTRNSFPEDLVYDLSIEDKGRQRTRKTVPKRGTTNRKWLLYFRNRSMLVCWGLTTKGGLYTLRLKKEAIAEDLVGSMYSSALAR